MEFLSLSRGHSSSWNAPSGEERGEMDVFAGYASVCGFVSGIVKMQGLHVFQMSDFMCEAEIWNRPTPKTHET